MNEMILKVEVFPFQSEQFPSAESCKDCHCEEQDILPFFGFLRFKEFEHLTDFLYCVDFPFFLNDSRECDIFAGISLHTLAEK